MTDATTPNLHEEWIAIEPPPQHVQTPQTHQTESIGECSTKFCFHCAHVQYTLSSVGISAPPEPPSFPESKFDIILRCQRPHPGLKVTNIPSHFINLSNDFEFAGWGLLLWFKLSSKDHERGEAMMGFLEGQKILGVFLVSALAGNDILGGVFYMLPAVVAVTSV